MDIFKQAAKQKLRFKTSQGLVTTEDLWDMPLLSKTKPLSELAFKPHRNYDYLIGRKSFTLQEFNYLLNNNFIYV